MPHAPSRDDASRKEFARRADAAYDRYVKPHLSSADTGRFVALDVESGAYEIDEDELSAIHRLRARCPSGRAWLARVGSPFVHRLGGGAVPRAK